MRGAGFEGATFDYQNASGDSSATNTIAQKMVQDGCDLIVGIATPAAQAAYNAAKPANIPVVFIAVSDPVSAGLAGEGVNVTGVADVLDVKSQVGIIKEHLPNVKTIGVIYSLGEVNSINQVAELKVAAESAGYTLETASISNQSELGTTLASLLPKVDVMVNTLDNAVVSALDLVVDKASEAGSGVIGSEEEQLDKGCIAAAGFNYTKVGEQAAPLAIRILGGEAASSIPFENATGVEIKINEAKMATITKGV
jgi:putative ABC transport system substrate-binding protein